MRLSDVHKVIKKLEAELEDAKDKKRVFEELAQLYKILYEHASPTVKEVFRQRAIEYKLKAHRQKWPKRSKITSGWTLQDIPDFKIPSAGNIEEGYQKLFEISAGNFIENGKIVPDELGKVYIINGKTILIPDPKKVEEFYNTTLEYGAPPRIMKFIECIQNKNAIELDPFEKLLKLPPKVKVGSPSSILTSMCVLPKNKKKNKKKIEIYFSDDKTEYGSPPYSKDALKDWKEIEVDGWKTYSVSEDNMILAVSYPTPNLFKRLRGDESIIKKVVEEAYKELLDLKKEGAPTEEVKEYLKDLSFVIENKLKKHKKKVYSGAAGTTITALLLSAVTQSPPDDKEKNYNIELLNTQFPDGGNYTTWIKAIAPADEHLQAQIALEHRVLNRTNLPPIKIFEDTWLYGSEVNLPGSEFRVGENELTVELYKDSDGDGIYENLVNFETFSVHKKPNKRPIINLNLTEQDDFNYSLKVSVTDDQNDPSPGCSKIEVYLDGKLIASANGAKLKTNISLYDKKAGDHVLKVRAYETESCFAEKKQIIHRNHKPWLKIESVKQIANDLYEIVYRFGDNDSKIKILEVKTTPVGNETKGNWTKIKVSGDTLKYYANLTHLIPSYYKVMARAFDGKEYSKIAQLKLKAENDDPKLKITAERKAGSEDVWNCKVNYNKPDGKIRKVILDVVKENQSIANASYEQNASSGSVAHEFDLTKIFPADLDLVVTVVDEYNKTVKRKLAKLIKLNNDAPSVFYTVKPVDGVSDGNIFDISYKAYDNDTKIAKIKFMGPYSKEFLRMCNSKEIEGKFAFNFSSDPPGHANITGWIEDELGNRYIIPATLIEIRDDPPKAKNVSLRYNPLPKGKQLWVKGEFYDPDTLIEGLELRLIARTQYNYNFNINPPSKHVIIDKLISTNILPGEYTAKFFAEEGKKHIPVYEGKMQSPKEYKIVLIETDPDNQKPQIMWNWDAGYAELIPYGFNHSIALINENYIKLVDPQIRKEYEKNKEWYINNYRTCDVIYSKFVHQWMWDLGYKGKDTIEENNLIVSKFTAFYRMLALDKVLKRSKNPWNPYTTSLALTFVDLIPALNGTWWRTLISDGPGTVTGEVDCRHEVDARTYEYYFGYADICNRTKFKGDYSDAVNALAWSLISTEMKGTTVVHPTFYDITTKKIGNKTSEEAFIEDMFYPSKDAKTENNQTKFYSTRAELYKQVALPLYSLYKLSWPNEQKVLLDCDGYGTWQTKWSYRVERLT